VLFLWCFLDFYLKRNKAIKKALCTVCRKAFFYYKLSDDLINKTLQDLESGKKPSIFCMQMLSFLTLNKKRKMKFSIQPPQNNSALVSQHYALLYCQYDLQHGNRDWTSLLKSDRVREIDLLIAQRALITGEDEATVTETIYWGSPAAQRINDFCERTYYAASIVEQAVAVHLNN
jgi:hypothetical protein